MATAEQLRAEFQAYLESRGIDYAVVDEADNIVLLAFEGSKYDTDVFCDFDEQGDEAESVHIVSQSYAKAFDKTAALLKINEVNSRFRWVKTYMDEEGFISSDLDAYVYPGIVGEEVTMLAISTSDIIEEILEHLEGVAIPKWE